MTELGRTPFFADDWLTIYEGDCRTVLSELPADSVDCVVTSPPFWGLRDYGVDGQLGLERTPDCGRRGTFRLRADLTDEQREYVVRRLAGVERRDE